MYIYSEQITSVLYVHLHKTLEGFPEKYLNKKACILSKHILILSKYDYTKGNIQFLVIPIFVYSSLKVPGTLYEKVAYSNVQ